MNFAENVGKVGIQFLKTKEKKKGVGKPLTMDVDCVDSDGPPGLISDSDEYSDDEVYRTKFKKSFVNKVAENVPKKNVVEESSDVSMDNGGGEVRNDVFDRDEVPKPADAYDDMPGLESDSDDEGSFRMSSTLIKSLT